MDVKKKDIVIEATWPMVGVTIAGVALLKLVKQAIKLSEKK